MKKAFFIAVIVFFIALDVQASIPQSYSLIEGLSAVEIDAKKQSREKIALRWEKALKSVVKKSGDQEALELLVFFQNNKVLIAPHREIGIALENSDSASWFLFAPMLKNDRFEDSFWEQFFQSGIICCFVPAERLIIAKDYIEVSDFWKGIIFLRQLFRAKQYLSHPYNYEDKEAFFIAEKDSFNFIQRILTLIGREKYKKNMDAMVSSVEQEMKRAFSKNKTNDISFEIQDPLDDKMEKVFGLAKSREERESRQAVFFVNSAFLFIERNFKTDRERQKTLLLKKIATDE